MAQPASFVDVLAGARAGDQKALAELTHQYEAKIRLVARLLLGAELRPFVDSMDLVQSVHRTLLAGLRKGSFELTGPDKLLALALTLVRRKVARQWRRHQRQVALDGSEKSRLLHTQPRSKRNRDSPAQEAEYVDQLRNVLANLSDQDRRLLEMRLEGYSAADIESELGIRPTALRVRLTRLRQRLRAMGLAEPSI